MGYMEPKKEVLVTENGASLHLARFEPEQQPLKVFQMIHGFGEHIGMYQGVAAYLVSQGFACVIHDQRGFGEMPDKTEGERRVSQGIIPGYQTLVDDVLLIRDQIDRWYGEIPVVLYGHSMGGNIALSCLLQLASAGIIHDRYQSAVLETPWLRLFHPVKKPLVWIARLLGRVSPKLALVNQLDLEDVSRDRKSVDSIKDDLYYHNRISFLLFSTVSDAGEYAIENASRIMLPVLLLCAGQDKIVSPDAIREFAARAGKNISLKEYPDAYHALHSDINRKEVMADILEFCLQES